MRKFVAQPRRFDRLATKSDIAVGMAMTADAHVKKKHKGRLATGVLPLGISILALATSDRVRINLDDYDVVAF